jgi:hypothetical protein
MTAERYDIIQMFHMGWVLQITLRWFNVLRSTLTLNHLTDLDKPLSWTSWLPVKCVSINTQGQRFSKQQASTNNYGPIAIHHSSEEGRFITWTQAGHQFVEISYPQIGLFLADTYCYVMTCS